MASQILKKPRLFNDQTVLNQIHSEMYRIQVEPKLEKSKGTVDVIDGKSGEKLTSIYTILLRFNI